MKYCTVIVFIGFFALEGSTALKHFNQALLSHASCNQPSVETLLLLFNNLQPAHQRIIHEKIRQDRTYLDLSIHLKRLQALYLYRLSKNTGRFNRYNRLYPSSSHITTRY